MAKSSVTPSSSLQRGCSTFPSPFADYAILFIATPTRSRLFTGDNVHLHSYEEIQLLLCRPARYDTLVLDEDVKS